MAIEGGSESAFVGLGRRELIGQMHKELDDLLAARDQMESLLRVVVDIGSNLDLETTLRRIITAAIDLTDARYGALGVRADDGSLAMFLFEGIGAELREQMGHLPVGKGVLGILLDRTDPLRVDDLTQHPASVGFPRNHPPMRAFLGVPITIRGDVYGSLYVTDDRSGRAFSESDEVAARALGAAAAVAIDNAQLFQRKRAVASWAAASREITATLLSGTNSHGPPLQLITERVRELTDAEQVVALIPAEDAEAADEVQSLVVSATSVESEPEVLVGQHIPIEGSTAGTVFRTGTPMITNRFEYPIRAFTHPGERLAVVVPLRADDRVIGVLAAARGIDQPLFTDDDLEWTVDFANHAAVALTLAQSREQAEEFTVLADRERIARDLHDAVIQRLFAAGMDLQRTLAMVHAPQVAERLTRTIDELQSTIDEIRTTIFNLKSPTVTTESFRQRIQQLVANFTDGGDITTALRIAGPMSIVEPHLADHAEAVVREAISNAVRHSGATNLTIDLVIGDDLTLSVIDDGRGIPAGNQRSSGLVNMQRRADEVGGSCRIVTPTEGGTQVHWTAPLTNR